MSEVYDDNKIVITAGDIAIQHRQISGTCEYCPTYTYNGYNFLGKVVCENCWEDLLKRINLIMKFQ